MPDEWIDNETRFHCTRRCRIGWLVDRYRGLGGLISRDVNRGDDAFEPNAWVLVDVSGNVVVTVARSEMGQGVRTSLAMLVAEELHVNWEDVNVVQAQAETERYGDQSTDSSRSVRENWLPLRRAGAAARSMLIQAAGEGWMVPVEECDTLPGTVVHEPSGRRLTYGALARAASKIPVPDAPPLKNPDDFYLIGHSVKRNDIPAKVNGTAGFGIDGRLPGMLTATVLRCPVLGGVLAEMDDSETRQVTA